MARSWTLRRQQRRWVVGSANAADGLADNNCSNPLHITPLAVHKTWCCFSSIKLGLIGSVLLTYSCQLPTVMTATCAPHAALCVWTQAAKLAEKEAKKAKAAAKAAAQQQAKASNNANSEKKAKLKAETEAKKVRGGLKVSVPALPVQQQRQRWQQSHHQQGGSDGGRCFPMPMPSSK